MLLTRREVLAAGSLGALTACTSSDPVPPAPVDPDVALVAAAVVREQALLTSYDDALAAHPELAALLTPLREQHFQHLARLQPATTATTTATAGPLGSPSRGGSPLARRAALAALERAASAAHGAAAVTASRQLAPLLASLSASEASHVVVL